MIDAVQVAAEVQQVQSLSDQTRQGAADRALPDAGAHVYLQVRSPVHTEHLALFTQTFEVNRTNTPMNEILSIWTG